MMFEEYYNLYEACEKIENPTYDDIIKIKKQWDDLTLKFFENFDLSEMTSMWTNLSANLCDSDKYWENFVEYLNYSSDRMNLNRWCRLQLLLGNCEDKLYCEK